MLQSMERNVSILLNSSQRIIIKDSLSKVWVLGPFQGQLLVVKGNKINLLEKKSELGMEQSRRDVYIVYEDRFWYFHSQLSLPAETRWKKRPGFQRRGWKNFKGTHKAVL